MGIVSQQFRSRLDAPRQFVWDCYVRDGMFERLSPPWQRVRTLQREGDITPGDWRLIRIAIGPAVIRWKASHIELRSGYLFTDEQTEGPFAYWKHEHHFEDGNGGSCILSDRVKYALPGSPLSHWFGEPLARRQIWRMFAYRHLISKLDIDRHYRYRNRPRLRVAVAGSPEASVDQLAAFLSAGGHDVVPDSTKAPGHNGTSGSLAQVEIELDGVIQARVWRVPQDGGDPGSGSPGSVTVDPNEVASLIRLATNHDPMFRNRGDAGQWAMREALISAVYRTLMEGYSAGPAAQ